jgi:Protein of unknown function (DUF1706)
MALPDPEELLKAIEDRWARIVPVLDSLPDEEVSGSWSVKDVYAHFARWSDVTSGAIRAHVEGKPTDEFDGYFNAYREWNTKWALEDRSIALADAAESAKAAHGRLIQTMRSLNREEWDSYVIAMAEDVIDHYQAHLDEPLRFETDPPR